jgi:hypothetical protein
MARRTGSAKREEAARSGEADCEEKPSGPSMGKTESFREDSI